MATKSLYERIGGESAIVAAVDLFYEKVMDDERTRRFFEGLDMTAQIHKQRAFLAWAFGAPEQYKGRDLRGAHEKLVKERGLGDAQFDAVAEHLQSTLVELEVPAELIDEALAIVAGARNQVLGR
jgi:hemoglobin